MSGEGWKNAIFQLDLCLKEGMWLKMKKVRFVSLLILAIMLIETCMPIITMAETIEDISEKEINTSAPVKATNENIGTESVSGKNEDSAGTEENVSNNEDEFRSAESVSYTHLTLPTKSLV